MGRQNLAERNQLRLFGSAQIALIGLGKHGDEKYRTLPMQCTQRSSVRELSALVSESNLSFSTNRDPQNRMPRQEPERAGLTDLRQLPLLQPVAGRCQSRESYQGYCA